MYRALFFDFNGVIVDDEPLHFQLFAEQLLSLGLSLSRERYYRDYLGMDDYECFLHAAKDQGLDLSEAQLTSLIAQKTQAYVRRIAEDPPFVPGALEFIRALASSHHLAIVSGALRSEIEMLIQRAQIKDCFSYIVAAGESARGKPEPDPYLRAFDGLNCDVVPTHQMLLPAECLAFEDSLWGIRSARSAGMAVVGLTTSYPAEHLLGALDYLPNFSDVEGQAYLQKLASLS